MIWWEDDKYIKINKKLIYLIIPTRDINTSTVYLFQFCQFGVNSDHKLCNNFTMLFSSTPSTCSNYPTSETNEPHTSTIGWISWTSLLLMHISSIWIEQRPRCGNLSSYLAPIQLFSCDLSKLPRNFSICRMLFLNCDNNWRN